MTSPSPSTTRLADATDAELLSSARIANSQANTTGISPDVWEALKAGRDGSDYMLLLVEQLGHRLAAYAERVVKLEAEVASLKAMQGAAEDRAAVEAVVKDITSNGTHKRVTAV